MTDPVRSTEYKVVFVPATGDDFGATAQEKLVMELSKEAWEWHGFATTSRATPLCIHGRGLIHCDVAGAAATETAGTLLYFRRAVLDVTVEPNEAKTTISSLLRRPNRATRRAAERSH
jgi:hypothetical protein